MNHNDIRKSRPSLLALKRSSKSQTYVIFQKILFLEFIPQWCKFTFVTLIAMVMYFYLSISILLSASNLVVTNNSEDIYHFPIETNNDISSLINFQTCTSVNSDFDNKLGIEFTSNNYPQNKVSDSLHQLFKKDKQNYV